MAERSEISWCDSTFNPWIGCTKVSPACDHCYAEADFALRKKFVEWGAGKPRHRTSASNWNLPRRWNKYACWFVECNDCGWRGESKGTVCSACGGADMKQARPRVFCASLADVFDNEVDPQWRSDLFQLIEQTPNLDWLLLTKRIGNVEKLTAGVSSWPNVWLGATICNQEEADRDIPKLLATPARVRFLSIEPMLGPINLRALDRGDLYFLDALTGRTRILHDGGMPKSPDLPRIDWVIVGGESGRDARPMHPQWVRNIRDQCAASGVPFHFKQWGEWHPYGSANYAIGPSQYRFGRVAGVSMLNDGRQCLALDKDNPAARATVIDADALDEWHRRLEALPESKDEQPDPLGYQWLHRVGRKAAGRLLDGITHNGFPDGARAM